MNRKKRLAPLKLYIGFGLIFLLSTSIGMSYYCTIEKHEKISQSIAHSYKVMNAAIDIKNLVNNMVSSRRGYRSTAQKILLDDFYAAKNKLATSFTELNNLVANDTQQTTQAIALEHHINDIVLFWSRLRLDIKKYDSAEITTVTLEEEKKFDAIELMVENFLNTEKQGIARNETNNDKMLAYLSWASPAQSITLQLLIFALIYIVIKELRMRKAVEAELVEKIAKEKQLNELKLRFITTASHQFRTPLSAILASTYLAAKYTKAEDQPKRENHYKKISASVHNLTEILEDLLSIDKLGTGKVNVNMQKFNIEEHLRSITGDFDILLKPGQDITYTHSGDPIMYSDPGILKHIISNLLSNAIKFSDEGKPITITSHQDDQSIAISIKDKGIGIPKSDIEYLFDYFHRGENAANIEGTGLGLHISAKYTKLLGGTIKCISEEGVGSEFILKFPRL